MIISVNWLKHFTQIDASIDELADVIGARLVEIEGVTSLVEKYKDVYVVNVVECSPVPDSDHLNVTKIDDGGVVEGAERDENGLVQVVCGAPNVRAGMRAAWLPPGSTVPETAGDNPFVLGARKLRGFMSNGMLASARELNLFDDHDGIIEVDKDVAPGTRFMHAYELDDQLLDIENKSLTHRPDTFGVIGFAREVAAVAGSGFTAPSWYGELSPSLSSAGTEDQPVGLSAGIDDESLSPRYQAVAVSIETAGKTPLEIQTYLSRSGVRPVSPIVDITNILMLLTGQPLHAFDYDKVRNVTGSTDIHVRGGHEGESLTLLDGRSILLDTDDIVIAAGDTAIALAGAMGGVETEIDESTTRIIIESATFDLYHLRRTQMRHGIFSEAITRFTKGQPAALTAPVLAEAVRMLMDWCGARVISNVVDAYPHPSVPTPIVLNADAINRALGTRYNTSDMMETLTNVGFDVAADGEALTVTPPFWRTDIHINEDIFEEIGRLNGFDSIEQRLPYRAASAVTPDGLQSLRQIIRSRLSADGANETLTYGFVHADLLKNANQSPDDAYALANALSPQLQRYRLSITPSLLDKVSMNVRQKFDEFALFELGKTHAVSDADADEPDLPRERSTVALTYVAAKTDGSRGDAYYVARKYATDLFGSLNAQQPRYVALTESDETDRAAAPFEPKRSAAVYIADRYIGVIGEYRRSVAQAFKLPIFSAGFEFDLDRLAEVASPIGQYVPLSRFPGSDSDVTFVLPNSVSYAELIDNVRTAIDAETTTITVAPLDLYRPEGSLELNVTLRFTFVSYDATLTREEVNAAISRISTSVTAAIAGSRII